MKRLISVSARRSVSLGFTLIEIMVVVAVVAILAAAAYPSYMESVRRGWRAEARTALMQEMQQQERVYTQKAKYKVDAPHKNFAGDAPASSKYEIDVEGCTDREAEQCIRLTAKLKSAFSDPAVQDIWVDSTGEKGCNGREPNRCWK